MERPHERSRLYLALLANNHQWRLTWRRVAMFIHATACGNSGLTFVLAVPFVQSAHSAMGIDPPFPQADAVAHILVNAPNAELAQDPVRRYRVADRFT